MKRDVEEVLAESKRARALSEEAIEKARALLSVQVVLAPEMSGKRFKTSGANIKESDRNTDFVKIRCAPELAAQVRAFCTEHGIPMAELLTAGLEAKRAAKP